MLTDKHSNRVNMYFLDMLPTLRFETEALGRVFHAAQVVLGPRTRGTDLHGHANFYELMGVLHGHGLHQLRTGTQPLRAGDLVLVRTRTSTACAGCRRTGSRSSTLPSRPRPGACSST